MSSPSQQNDVITVLRPEAARGGWVPRILCDTITIHLCSLQFSLLADRFAPLPRKSQTLFHLSAVLVWQNLF